MNESELPPSLAKHVLGELERLIGVFGMVEFVVAAALIALAVAAPRLGSGHWARFEQRMAWLSRHPVRQIVFVGLLALAARAAMLPWLGAPAALIHDEQSLLLQAHTYMAGRLVNPTHPFWEHFESFHINQIPAYASMYFPGRGAPLAAGLLIADHPWAGVWLSMVLMVMAVVWMLQGWVSLPMALLGGVLVVARLGVFSYWVNSYWGGAFTAIGGLLVMGALPRLLNQPRWRHGLLMGVGAVILMTTRPYEGFLVCLPVVAFLCVRLVRPAWTGGRAAFVKVAAPAVVFIGAGAALLLSYNLAATGNWLKTPYSLNREAYATAPAFLVSAPVKSELRGPPHFRAFYTAESRSYDRRHSVLEIVRSVSAKLLYSWNFYVGASLGLALLAGLWASRREALLIGTLCFFFGFYFLETWNFPHYTAPVFAVILILTMRGFEWLRSLQGRWADTGLALSRAMPVAVVAMLALPASSLWFGRPALASNVHSNPCCVVKSDSLRSQLIRQLKASPGRDLVLVKSNAHNPIHLELVYNDPDIDASEIVWAHSLGPERDLALRRHFHDRKVWTFEWQPGTRTGFQLAPLESPATDRLAGPSQ